MNHRTRVDWNYIWIALYHATQNNDDIAENDNVHRQLFQNNIRKKILQMLGGKSKIKFVLKDEIKHVPALGAIL